MGGKFSKASASEEKEGATGPSSAHTSKDSTKKSSKKVNQVLRYYFTRKIRQKFKDRSSQCSVFGGSDISAVAPATVVKRALTLEDFRQDLVIRNPYWKPMTPALGLSARPKGINSPSNTFSDSSVQGKCVRGLVSRVSHYDVQVLTDRQSSTNVKNLTQRSRSQKRSTESFPDFGKWFVEHATNTLADQKYGLEESDDASAKGDQVRGKLYEDKKEKDWGVKFIDRHVKAVDVGEYREKSEENWRQASENTLDDTGDLQAFQKLQPCDEKDKDALSEPVLSSVETHIPAAETLLPAVETLYPVEKKLTAVEELPTLKELPSVDERPTLEELTAVEELPAVEGLPTVEELPAVKEFPAVEGHPAVEKLPTAEELLTTLVPFFVQDEAGSLAQNKCSQANDAKTAHWAEFPGASTSTSQVPFSDELRCGATPFNTQQSTGYSIEETKQPSKCGSTEQLPREAALIYDKSVTGNNQTVLNTSHDTKLGGPVNTEMFLLESERVGVEEPKHVSSWHHGIREAQVESLKQGSGRGHESPSTTSVLQDGIVKQSTTIKSKLRARKTSHKIVRSRQGLQANLKNSATGPQGAYVYRNQWRALPGLVVHVPLMRNSAVYRVPEARSHVSDRKWKPGDLGEEQMQGLCGRQTIRGPNPTAAPENLPLLTDSTSLPEKGLPTEKLTANRAAVPGVCTQIMDESRASYHEKAFKKLQQDESHRGGVAKRSRRLVIPSWFLLVCIALLMAFSYNAGVMLGHGKL